MNLHLEAFINGFKKGFISGTIVSVLAVLAYVLWHMGG